VNNFKCMKIGRMTWSSFGRFIIYIVKFLTYLLGAGHGDPFPRPAETITVI
jgi:hypothetical protein